MYQKGIDHYLEAAKRSAAWHENHLAEIKKCRFDTMAVHGIYSMQEAIDFNQGSIIEPIYMSTAQAYRDSDEMEAALAYQIPTWCYSRIANPSMYYLEGVLALLEGYGADIGTSCIATSSGMAAIQTAVDPFLLPDAENSKEQINFVSAAQVYGGTFQQFAVRKEKERGIQWRRVINPGNIDEWEKLIDKNTRFVYGELPSNPGQSFFDLKKVVDLSHQHNVPVIIDSTVATPALLRPLALGADIVVQSVTKTLSTSGFGIAGAVISRKNLVSKVGSAKMKADFSLYAKTLPNRDNGPNISPMNAALALNDIRTLRSRVDIQSRSAMTVARHLSGHRHVEQVDYLGLESHPLHRLASEYLWLVDAEHDEQYKQPLNRYGHLLSFRIKGRPEKTRDVFDAFTMIFRATDLGRIKSVATIPAISTHSQQNEDDRKKADIPPNLIRLCVGAENPDDIIKDLERSLSVLDGKKVSFTAPEFSAGGASSALLRRRDEVIE